MADLGFAFDDDDDPNAIADQSQSSFSLFKGGGESNQMQDVFEHYVFSSSQQSMDFKRRIIDESLTPLQQLERYSASEDAFHRIWFIVNFTRLMGSELVNKKHSNTTDAKQLAVENTAFVNFYLEKLAICLYFHGDEHLTRTFFAELWPIIDWICNEQQMDIQHFVDSLVQIYLMILTPVKREIFIKSISSICREHFPPLVEFICHSITATLKDLLVQPHKCDPFDGASAILIESIGDLVSDAFVNDFLGSYLQHLMLEQAKNAQIQQTCLKILGKLYEEHAKIKHSSREKLHLFQAYCKLASDKREVVRKEACSILPTIARQVSLEVKNGPISSIYSAFLSDESKAVQIEAKCQLGKMIFAFYPHPIPKFFSLLMQELVANSSVFSGSSSDISQIRILQSLAYCFPAIVLSYSQNDGVDENWKFLQPILKKLTKIVHVSIAKSISFGLHEIAALIGQEKAEKDVFPLLIHFLRDQEAIKIGVLQNLDRICECFSPKFLGQNLSSIISAAMFNIKKSWRIRVQVIMQFGKLCNRVSIDLAKGELFRWICEFCKDPIGAVREEAVNSFLEFARVVKVAGSKRIFNDAILENVKKMQQSPLQRYQIMGDEIERRLNLM